MATPNWYTSALLSALQGSLDLDTGTFKLGLYTSSYVLDQDAHDFRDDLGANEASGGSGYPAGGFTIVPVLSKATKTVKWDPGDVSQAITGGPFAFRYGVFYKSLGGLASADPLIGYVDFGAQSITGATLNIALTDPLKLVLP